MAATLTTLTTSTAKGDRVTVRCLNTQRIVTGVVRYSGSSSTPGCWRVDIIPDDARHPVSPVIHAWRVAP